MALKFYNTLSRKKEVFKPIKGKKVGLYTCGPTVYWFAHVGNLRTYIFEDILKRVLQYNDYRVEHVMNITDVGHLTSDADTGEDKIEIGAKREKKTAWQIAEFYARAFKNDLKLLNIKEPDIWARATATVKEQIDLIKVLEKKSFTYKITDGIYFDTSKIKDYGKLAGRKKQKLKTRGRVEMVPGKKNPADFALWKFTPVGVKRQMEWDSPWGKGFPGWHTECVAMSAKFLGLPFDVHCGGIDHIPIHHTNEIAQSEAAFGKNLARFWLHGEFLTINRGRMGKSEGNIIILDNLIKKGFNPLAYRYLCLNAHYRSKLSFSWHSLRSAQNGLNNLYEKMCGGDPRTFSAADPPPVLVSIRTYQKKFLDLVNDDLNTPKALALLWQVIKDDRLKMKDKRDLLLDFDKVFGLGLAKIKKPRIPQEIKKLAELRERYRQEKNWLKADEIRKKIGQQGYWVEDTKNGPKIKKLAE